MADVEYLRRVIEPHTEADVTKTFERFRDATGSNDSSHFVHYMVDRGLLAPDAARRIQEELTVDRSNAATVVLARDADSPGEGTVPEGRGPTRAPLPARETGIRLDGVLGRGGMGTVFRAEQLDLGREVAFKQLTDDSDEELRDRFVREARITAQLDHPHIVPVHVLEVSPDGRSIGYAMKLVEGKTLRVLLRETAAAYKNQLPIDEEHSLPRRLEHFLKICDAIAFAHDRGILHRDLKPANFMIGHFGEVYVMDWGVARPIGSVEARAAAGRENASAEPELTQLGDIIGSAPYMSPEQAAGRNNELDARADQYALGLILYEVVSLKRAIATATADEALEMARAGQKAPLEHVSPRKRIAQELRAIIEKATAFAPGDRYPSVGALAEDVRRYLRGLEVVARPDTFLQKLLRQMSRHRRATLLAFVGVLGLAAITVSWTLYRKAAGELAVRARGERVTELFIEVAAQAHHIDVQFQRLQEALEGLRTAAVWALTGPEPPAEQAPLYFHTDFANPARRPPDFTDKTTYRWPVSVEHPVIGMAPDANREALLPKIRRLSPLREHMRAMFVTAATGGKTLPDAAEQRAILLERRGPIDYAYIDLPEGVHFMLPGYDALPPGYDCRTAGFYKISDHQRGKRWGAPYIDSTTDEKGDDLVLPCTEGIWSPAGEFLGVAGVEITVTKMVDTTLVLPGRKTIRTSLVNGDGKKVIDSNDAGKRFQSDGKDEGLALVDFDIPELVTAIRAGGAGVRELRRDGRELLVMFARLDVLGWYYVVELDAREVLGS